MTTKNDMTTTSGEKFSYDDSAGMAWMIYRRFGRDLPAAAAAWRRLLGNSCTDNQFMDLVNHGMHLDPAVRAAVLEVKAALLEEQLTDALALLSDLADTENGPRMSQYWRNDVTKAALRIREFLEKKS